MTEDDGADAQETLKALLRRMLLLIEGSSQTHRIRFLPASSEEAEAMRGSAWKDTGPRGHERRVRLLRYIARRLCQQNTFVVFHVDGDRPWALRDQSENVAKFDRLIVDALPRVVDAGRAAVLLRRPAEETPKGAPLAEHLLLVCPFYSIEAWLYQNTKQAAVICSREHHGRHVADLERWQANRHALDEEERPKRTSCLADRYNAELASQGFPAEAVYYVNKSFAQSVNRLMSCEALCAALCKTDG